MERGDISICKVGTENNVAGPLTKPLPLAKHEGHVASMRLKRVPKLL